MNIRHTATSMLPPKKWFDSSKGDAMPTPKKWFDSEKGDVFPQPKGGVK